jgi:hypothetical protein
MRKGAIHEANETEKEQIIDVVQIHKIAMKPHRKRMQKDEEEMEKQTKLNVARSCDQ